MLPASLFLSYIAFLCRFCPSVSGYTVERFIGSKDDHNGPQSYPAMPNDRVSFFMSHFFPFPLFPTFFNPHTPSWLTTHSHQPITQFVSQMPACLVMRVRTHMSPADGCAHLIAFFHQFPSSAIFLTYPLDAAQHAFEHMDALRQSCSKHSDKIVPLFPEDAHSTQTPEVIAAKDAERTGPEDRILFRSLQASMRRAVNATIPSMRRAVNATNPPSTPCEYFVFGDIDSLYTANLGKIIRKVVRRADLVVTGYVDVSECLFYMV